jgi:hypothetical protein
MSVYSIIVPDSSPLITLAAADALDTLLKPGLPVLIPDGVHWEVTRFINLQGASEVIDWMAQNEDHVLLRATQEFLNHQTLVNAGVKRISNLGENCAREIVDREAERHPDHKSILLYEDSDVTLLKIMNPDKVDALTTADFLSELEHARLIQSADRILDDAVAAGRGEGVRDRAHFEMLHAFSAKRGGIGS